MSTFTATNGMTVERDHNNDVVIDRATNHVSVFMGDGTALALRDFFQHEKDEEVGRWRWPENLDYVVYPDAECRDLVNVVCELDAKRLTYDRADMPGRETDRHRDHHDAAVAYFEAHPERKPWEDAKPGEAWEITYTALASPEVTKVAIRTDRNTWKTDVLEMEFNHAITAARRIWPEDAS